MRFTGKVAVVTGAGSGMGAEFCRRLAAEGAAVAVLDVDVGGGEATAAKICESGGRAMFVLADVTQADSMDRAIAAVVAEYGGIDVAINNAGIAGARQPITSTDPAVWRRAIEVNLTGVFLSMRAQIAEMVNNGVSRGGAIVNISSITGVIAHPGAAAYVASKHGVIGLTKSAALEWGHAGIRINAVAPTWVRTPMTEQAFSDDRWKELGERHALGRCATMEEVADVVLFLASSQAGIVTGAVYLADAGYTAQ